MDTSGDGLADQLLSGKMELTDGLRGTIERITYHNEDEGSVYLPAADLLAVSPVLVADGIRTLSAMEKADEVAIFARSTPREPRNEFAGGWAEKGVGEQKPQLGMGVERKTTQSEARPRFGKLANRLVDLNQLLSALSGCGRQAEQLGPSPADFHDQVISRHVLSQIDDPPTVPSQGERDQDDSHVMPF